MTCVTVFHQIFLHLSVMIERGSQREVIRHLYLDKHEELWVMCDVRDNRSKDKLIKMTNKQRQETQIGFLFLKFI